MFHDGGRNAAVVVVSSIEENDKVLILTLVTDTIHKGADRMVASEGSQIDRTPVLHENRLGPGSRSEYGAAEEQAKD